MIGYVSIFINKKQEIFVVVSNKAKNGLIISISNLEGPIEISELYQCVETKIKYSLEMYHKNIEGIEYYKNGIYKSWNKFFSDNSLILICYDDTSKIYNLTLREKYLKEKAYGLINKNFNFNLSPEEFKNSFTNIIENIMKYIKER